MDDELVESWQQAVQRIWLWAFALAVLGLWWDSTLMQILSIVFFLANFWFTNKYPVEDGPVTEESL